MKQFLQRCALMALALSAPFAAQAQTSDLLISEYIEGSGFSKAVEIYNGTASSIDLGAGQYRLELYTNGASSPGNSVSLSGPLAAGEVLVLCHSSANAAILAECDVQSNGTINFNGDDALVLRKASTSAGNGTVVDSLGDVGFDPGSEWGGVTADNTLRRKNTVCAGDTTLDDDFVPATEWDSFVNNTFDGIGSHTANCILGPVLGIADNTGAEGDSGTRSLDITVSLSVPAPAGGVSFTISDAGTGTATAGTDYVAFAPFTAGIAEGADSYTFQITINGDTDDEPNESIVLTLSGVDGDVESGDLSAIATIQNDDAPITPINDIQGNGSASALDGNVLTTEGVITVIRGNGFFIQSTAEHDDGDATTSDGLWVFTGGAPQASLAVGDVVQVSGTVDEFQPVSFTYPVTELLPSNIVETGTAALPTPVEITAADFAGPLIEPDVLEHLEGMYVHIASARIVAPTRSVNAEFEVVVDGVARPLREAGISIFDPYDVPAGLEATIPWFDANQERIKLRPAVGGTPLLDARGSVADVYGALDYVGSSGAVNSWQVWYDPNLIEVASGAPQAVADAGANDITVAGFNMLRFGIDGNEANRRTKAAAVICDWLKAPDILGVSEVDDIATLTALADQLNATCASAPAYAPHLVEGNDVGGIDVGFLVSHRAVREGVRVEVLEVEQHGKDTVQKNKDGSDSDKLLNDRPPLRLKAVVHFTDGRRYPLTVIAAHQRSLSDVDSSDAVNPATHLGYSIRGEEVRAKRAEQAAYVAQLVDDLQTADPSGKIVLVGDFNAFDVNDGYVDALGITTGNPAPETEVIHWADSPLSPANGGRPLLVGNELTANPEERYSYIFGNITQTLDHVLVNEALVEDAAVTGATVDHARVNADFRSGHQSVYNPPYTAENPPLRTSDHDPVRLTIAIKPDTTPPTLAPVLPGLILQGGTYVVTPNASDENGIASASCSPTPLDTGSRGAKSVTCTATDLAGNTASVTLSYTVTSAQFQWQQPLLPVVYSVKADQRVLLQWRLVNTQGGWVDTLEGATVTSAPIACPSPFAIALPPYTGSPIELQNIGTGMYRKTWQVAAAQAGTCLRMNLDVGDGKPHTVLFKLK